MNAKYLYKLETNGTIMVLRAAWHCASCIFATLDHDEQERHTKEQKHYLNTVPVGSPEVYAFEKHGPIPEKILNGFYEKLDALVGDERYETPGAVEQWKAMAAQQAAQAGDEDNEKEPVTELSILCMVHRCDGWAFVSTSGIEEGWTLCEDHYWQWINVGELKEGPPR